MYANPKPGEPEYLGFAGFGDGLARAAALEAQHPVAVGVFGDDDVVVRRSFLVEGFFGAVRAAGQREQRREQQEGGV